MFQFGRFPSRFRGMTGLETRRVSPFGYLRLLRSYTPHRSFSQYNTSFFGTRYLGIHCVPLVAFRTIVRSLRLSWHALLGITFALIILLLRRTRRAFHHSVRKFTPAQRQTQYRILKAIYEFPSACSSLSSVNAILGKIASFSQIYDVFAAE